MRFPRFYNILISFFRITVVSFILVFSCLGSIQAQYMNNVLDVNVHNRVDFNCFDNSHDLSQFPITSILQDKEGFMWFGTYNGLYRYDGFSVVLLRHSFQNHESLIANRIFSIAEKSDNELWIGSEEGLMIYNKASGKVSDLSFATSKLHTLLITSLYVDSNKNLWVGTDKGVVLGRPSSKGEYEFSESIHMREKYITSFCEGVKHNVWIATQTGVYRGQWINFDFKAQLLDFTKNSTINILYKDKNNQMWIGGINFFAVVKINNSILDYKQIFTPVFKNFNTSINAIVEDTLNNGMWVGLGGNNGLFYFKFDSLNQVVNKQYYDDSTFHGRISQNDISALKIDKSNVLWVGTRKGINHANLTRKKFNDVEALLTHAYNQLGYKGEYINTLFVDDEQNLWISTYKKGLYRYDPNKGVMHNESSLVTDHSVFQMVQAKNGDLFFASTEVVYQLFKNKNGKGYSRSMKIDIPSVVLRTRLKGAIVLDKFNNLWITTTKGVVKYNPDTKKSIEYTTLQGLPPVESRVYQVYEDPNLLVIWLVDKESGLTKISYNQTENIQVELMLTKSQLSNNYIWEVYVDRSKRMWLGTDTGVDLLSIKNDSVQSLEHILHPLLVNVKILSIIQDQNGSMWFGTNQGLIYYNPKTKQAKKYSYEDGLQSNSYTEAITITRDGVIFVGGTNGLNYFQPNQLTNNKFLSLTAFTAFKCRNQNVEIGKEYSGSVILNQDINSTNKITLNYKQNNFTIEFASLHFAAPLLNKYKYMLEGYDSTWIQVDQSHRFASYSNLPSGKYTFKLITSNNDEIWNNTAKVLDIKILPPPWLTYWAFAAYFLIIAFISYMFIRFLLERQNWKNELIIQKIENEKIEAVNEMKMNFFTNITHEFRTPLVLILGPLRDLIEHSSNYDEYLNFRHNIINKNAQKLFSLINQVLNLRKMSTDKMLLTIRRHNLNLVVDEMVTYFKHFANKKGITLKLESEADFSEAWFDLDKIEKVLQNIISNALKYTLDGGNVTIQLLSSEFLKDGKTYRQARIVVKDTGIGIDKSQIGKIFDMFYTVNHGYDNSTGIGLAFSQLLMKSHSGNIFVESKPEVGSEFSIVFPVDKDCYTSEIVVTEQTDSTEITVKEEEIPIKYHRTVLIVEDNDDMRSYIRESLKSAFHIIEASNGKEGLILARKKLPDTIICDLMMPEIDGLLLIEKLKEDNRTSYIPVIVHSVKDDYETISKALEKGAYEYIVKPFDPTILIHKINSLLNTREEYERKVKIDMSIVPSDITIESSDLQLLNKILRTVEDNIQNSELDAEMIAKNIGMSRMQLYRRLKSMIGGKQISEIILEVRLKRAAQLLASGEKRISEVMYETGFSNNTRFKNHFTNYYNITPAEYIKLHSEKTEEQ